MLKIAEKNKYDQTILKCLIEYDRQDLYKK